MASIPPTPTTPRTPRTPGTPGFNTKSPTIKRILQESRELSLSPDPSLTAAPLETNLFEWHFTLTGPPSSPYDHGVYHGRIVLPTTYPLRPPSFRFLTPSGRFEVNREICLSISGHHEETWQPAWGIRTALCAIRAFMASDAKGQIGGIDMNEESRRLLAKQSRHWKCSGCGSRTNEEIITECEAQWRHSHEENPQQGTPDITIPKELRLAYKDDMERGPPTPIAWSSTGASDLNEVQDRLGASPPNGKPGPVANILARSKPPPSPLRATSSALEERSAARSSPVPTGSKASRIQTSTASSALAQPPMTTQDTSRAYTDTKLLHQSSHNSSAVPKWVDIAILVLAMAIIYLAIGKLFT